MHFIPTSVSYTRMQIQLHDNGSQGEMNNDYFSIEDRYKLLAHKCGAWSTLNEVFSKLLLEVAIAGNDDLQAVVKRYAFLERYICMIFSSTIQYEFQAKYTEIYSTDKNFERTLYLVLCCYENSNWVLASLPISNGRPMKNTDAIRQYIEDLPNMFTTEKAILTRA